MQAVAENAVDGIDHQNPLPETAPLKIIYRQRNWPASFMQHLWICHCCGKRFNNLALVVALLAPDPWFDLTETEREARGKIDNNLCSIDDHYFVRGCLDIPIVGQDDVFSFGVWVSVSKESFRLVLDLWDEEIRGDQPPLFGWLCNRILGYPDTYALKTHVHLRNGGIRPFVELEPTDHPLAIEQRDGVALKRVEEIVAATHLQ